MPEYRAPFHQERVLDAAGFADPGVVPLSKAQVDRAIEHVLDDLV